MLRFSNSLWCGTCILFFLYYTDFTESIGGYYYDVEAANSG